MKRASFLALGTAFLMGCQDEPPTWPDFADGDNPLFEIQDALHGGGNEHFFFLPPLVPAPTFGGVFNATRSPAVEICLINEETGACAGEPLVTFTMDDGPGSKTVRVSAEDQHYVVNWHTAQFALDPGAIYRIHVVELAGALGFADFVVGKNVKTLPIKFRIEEGLPFVVDENGGAISAAGGDVVVAVPPNAVASGEEVPVTVDEVPPEDPTLPEATGELPGTVFDFGPVGTQFAEPVRITVAYDPAIIPAGVPEEGLRLFTLVDGHWELLLDGSVDTGANTVTGFTDHFSTFGTLSIARFCPANPGPTSFVTFAEAFAAVIVGGTIEMCDGTHVVEGVVINAPVTIQPEPGASPVIETSVALSTFFLDGYTSGTVLIDGLTFNFSTPNPDPDDLSTRSSAIRGTGTYDQLIVRNSTFNIDPVSRGSVFFWNNTVTGSGALVENTTFNGGFGVAVFEAGPDTQLDVRNSHFFGTRRRALFYSETSGRIENSTFTDCFGSQCILVINGSQVDVLSNDFAAPDLTGAVASSVNQIVLYSSGSSGLVDDNDFGGCGEFRCVQVVQEGTQVDVTNNRFQVDPADGVNINPDHAVVRHNLGAIGTVENNQFNGCFRYCISVWTGADVLVRGNEINIPNGHTTEWGIHGFANDDPTSLTIEDNTIIADMTGVVPSDRSTFRITGAGIALDNATATVYRNTIVGGNGGVIAFNGGRITAGEDNIIDQSFVGVLILDDAGINLNFNDITNSVFSIFDEFIRSDLDCNWWGDIAGPGSTANTVDSGTFTPFATAPIAGTDHSGCSPVDDENLFVGSWTATSIIRDGVEILVETDLSLNLTFRSDLTFSESVSGDTGHLFCDDATDCTDDGTYVFTSTLLSICDPQCDEVILEYTISGNTLTVVFEDEDGVMFTFTLVRVT